MLTVPPWGIILSQGRNDEIKNLMVLFVVGYEGVINDNRNQKEATVRERLLLIPIIHYMEVQEILWYCEVIQLMWRISEYWRWR